MKIKNKWFTLVEVVTIITILVILATIWFLSFNGYTSSARDSVRLSDLKSIEKALVFNNLKSKTFPEPENFTILSWEDFLEWVNWKKWKFWEVQFKNLSRYLNSLFLDPKTNEKYDYYVSEDGKYYVIEWLKEVNWEKIILTNYENLKEIRKSFNTSWNENSSSWGVTQWWSETTQWWSNIDNTQNNPQSSSDKWVALILNKEKFKTWEKVEVTILNWDYSWTDWIGISTEWSSNTSYISYSYVKDIIDNKWSYVFSGAWRYEFRYYLNNWYEFSVKTKVFTVEDSNN